MTSSPLFLVRSFVLTAWAGFFTWLVLSGEMRRYIGPRNYWVVIFGAVALTLAAIVHFRAGERGSPEKHIKAREALGLLAVMLPILVILVVPKPSLGALAASKKGSGGIISATAGIQPPTSRIPGGELSLEEIEYASQSSEYAAAVGIIEGVSVKLVGFVTHPKKSATGTFALTRFAIFCCAADAVPYTVRVTPPPGTPDFEDDKWLEIKGTLAKDNDGFYVEASEIDSISEPSSPYIN